MLVMDCGKNTATIYNSETDSCITVSHQQVLEYDFPRDSLVVGENAHFGTERTDRSLSQPFTADELTQWYSRLQNAGVILKLFPEQSTPLAIQHSGLSKSDENDPKSIFLYLKDNAHLIVTLKNPPVTFAEDPIRIEGYQKKDDLNIQLNRLEDMGIKTQKIS